MRLLCKENFKWIKGFYNLTLEGMIDGKCKFDGGSINRGSTCNVSVPGLSLLRSILGNIVVSLLYRGSLHGFMPQDFHQRCDYKSPTLTLF